jgi:hypothetical protein
METATILQEFERRRGSQETSAEDRRRALTSENMLGDFGLSHPNTRRLLSPTHQPPPGMAAWRNSPANLTRGNDGKKR